jgi:hypothetical protein
MSNDLPVNTNAAGDDELTLRLDALGRSLVAAEADAAPVSGPSSDTPFMQAVERRAQFRNAARWAPRLALAAAAAITVVAGYLVMRTAPSAPPTPPIAINDQTGESQPPTLANLRNLNRNVTSPEGLKLAGGSAAPASAQPVRVEDATAQAISPADARAPARIDAIMAGK